MSVAFRRESDEEHLEPRFDRPIPPGPNLVTERGLRLLAERVRALETRLPDASEAERPEIERDLRYWRQRLATARLAPTPPDDEIGIGTRVRYQLNGAEAEVAIVGIDEADPDGGSIAFTAPLARAMIGAGVDDLLAYGGRPDAIEIVAIDGRPHIST